MASTRDILKPQINEVLQCLDTLKSKTSIKKATKLLDNLANELRLEFGKLPGSKRNIDLCRTVNINVEKSPGKVERMPQRTANDTNIYVCVCFYLQGIGREPIHFNKAAFVVSNAFFDSGTDGGTVNFTSNFTVGNHTFP
jgi:hypothetical protein